MKSSNGSSRKDDVLDEQLQQVLFEIGKEDIPDRVLDLAHHLETLLQQRQKRRR
ncbi:hypothetical protein [Stappia stellulata]|uniref:hypothetical protein n=1 Tax=Stappia stellulata TaxID=71235 RepID=UPI0012EB35E6|nr:hypothetical protein [Stappia stellulata]